jgi:hypothetical protein
MKKMFAPCLMSLLAACGGPVEAESQMEASSPSTVESALIQCGTYCPSGYHSTSYFCSYSCGSSSFCPSYNAVTCEVNSGTSFNTCDSNCPSGYHITAYSYVYSCETSPNTSGPNKTQATCEVNSSTGFYTCGIGCPSGYRAVGYSSSYSCVIARNSYPSRNNMTYCVP